MVVIRASFYIKQHTNNKQYDTECNHSNIIHTNEGLVCRNCGLIIREEKTYINNVNIKDNEQSINTVKYPKFSRLSYLIEKYHYPEFQKRIITNERKDEIYRICSQLHLMHVFNDTILLFKNIKMKMDRVPYGFYYNLGVLVYIVCKKRRIIVDKKEIIRINNTNLSSFNRCLTLILAQMRINTFSEEEIFIHIFSAINRLKINKKNYTDAITLYKKYRLNLQGKPKIIASVVVIMAYYMNYENNDIKYSVTRIHRKLGIDFRSVANSYYERIFGYLIQERFRFIAMYRLSSLRYRLIGE